MNAILLQVITRTFNKIRSSWVVQDIKLKKDLNLTIQQESYYRIWYKIYMEYIENIDIIFLICISDEKHTSWLPRWYEINIELIGSDKYKVKESKPKNKKEIKKY